MKGKKKGFFFCFIFLSKRELFNCRILCPCVELYSRMYPDHYIIIIERKRIEHTNLLLVSVLFCIQFIWEIVLTLFVQLKHLFKKKDTHTHVPVSSFSHFFNWKKQQNTVITTLVPSNFFWSFDPPLHFTWSYYYYYCYIPFSGNTRLQQHFRVSVRIYFYRYL